VQRRAEASRERGRCPRFLMEGALAVVTEERCAKGVLRLRVERRRGDARVQPARQERDAAHHAQLLTVSVAGADRE
jgi:hypothetical protein